MVSIKEALGICVETLKGSVTSPIMEAEIILGFVLKKSVLELRVHKDSPICPEDEKKAVELCKRRALGEPSAYITGTKEFMSLEFEVCPDVLIPRPDTETVTEYIIEKYKDKEVNILDLCTGSGAICCSLAHYMPLSRLSATDISLGALNIARKNAKKHGVEKRIDFFHKDALSDYGFQEIFDVVVSNPPYIETSVLPSLMKDVADFEPSLALDGGSDGLIFYKSIVNNIRKILKCGGELIFEIGYNQGEALKEIMKNDFVHIEITKDLAGNDRMVTGQLV